AADLGVEVDVHLVLEDHRLVVGQPQQQAAQLGQDGLAPGVPAPQDGAGPAPGDLLAAQPAADGVAADRQAVPPPQEHGDGLAAPAAAQEAEVARQLLGDPADHHGDPAGRQARGGAARPVEQGLGAAGGEAPLPAGDGAGAAVEHGGDGGPG